MTASRRLRLARLARLITVRFHFLRLWHIAVDLQPYRAGGMYATAERWAERCCLTCAVNSFMALLWTVILLLLGAALLTLTQTKALDRMDRINIPQADAQAVLLAEHM